MPETTVEAIYDAVCVMARAIEDQLGSVGGSLTSLTYIVADNEPSSTVEVEYRQHGDTPLRITVAFTR